MKNLYHIGNCKHTKSSFYVLVTWNGVCLSFMGALFLPRKQNPQQYGQIQNQILQHLDNGELCPAPNWTADKIRQLCNLWKHWHLNDMQANCEHQVGDEWNGEQILAIYNFRLRPELLKQQEEVESLYYEAVETAQDVNLTETQRTTLRHPKYITYHLDKLPPPLDKLYIPNTPEHPSETHRVFCQYKYAASVCPTEHPKGLLNKPCPVCGYRYGTEWKYKPVPPEVFSQLWQMPISGKLPAHVIKLFQR